MVKFYLKKYLLSTTLLRSSLSYLNFKLWLKPVTSICITTPLKGEVMQ